jgi:hypothetical protein
MGLKVEEAHQKLRTVINASWEAYTHSAAAAAATSVTAGLGGSSGSSGSATAGGTQEATTAVQLPACLLAALPQAASSSSSSSSSLVVQASSLPRRLDQSSQAYSSLRRAVLDTERALLYTLEFDVAVEHPYPLIKSAVQSWKDQGLFGSLFPRGRTLREAPLELAQAILLATNLAFTMVGSDLCLRFTAQELALASLYLAFTLTFTQHGRALPVPLDAFRKAGGGAGGGGGGGGSAGVDLLRVIRDVCDRFRAYLEEDTRADAEYRQGEVDMNSGGGGSSSSSSSRLVNVELLLRGRAGAADAAGAAAAAAAAAAASSASGFTPGAGSFSEEGAAYEPSPTSASGSARSGRPYALGDTEGADDDGPEAEEDEEEEMRGVGGMAADDGEVGAPTLGAAAAARGSNVTDEGSLLSPSSATRGGIEAGEGMQEDG